MAELDDYTVWLGILLVMSIIIGAALNVPLLIFALLGMVGITLTAVFAGARK